MHQVGDSRGQVMQDVQAGSITRVPPCEGSGEITTASAEPCHRPRIPPPPLSWALSATHRDHPRPTDPGHRAARIAGGLGRNRILLAPSLRASSLPYVQPAPRPYAAVFLRTRG